MTTAADGRRLPWSLWLLPSAQPSTPPFQMLIDRLAAAHGGPAFDAHLTLHAGTCAVDVDPLPAVRAAAAAAGPVRLRAGPCAHSDAYFKTFFVTFADVPQAPQALERLRARLVDAWCAADAAGPAPDQALAAYRLAPHLSLLYARVAPALRRQLCREHDFDGETVVFDRLAFVRPAPGRVDLANVADWQVLGACRLGTAAAAR